MRQFSYYILQTCKNWNKYSDKTKQKILKSVGENGQWISETASTYVISYQYTMLIMLLTSNKDDNMK